MKLRAQTVFPALFLALSLTMFAAFNLSRPRILVLHSYDASYIWTQDVTEGLKRVLADNYQVDLRWYYMDTKRHPSENFKRNAGNAARNILLTTRPDVVIAVDDDAQEWVTRYFINDPHIRFVFAGVNSTLEAHGLEKARNVTGILERMPLTAMRDGLMSMRLASGSAPGRIAFLGDQSNSVSADAGQVKNFDWAPLRLNEVRQVSTWPEWKTAVLELGQKADVLLVTNYRKLRRSATDAALVGPAEVVAWTQAHTPIPVLSGNSFFIEDGGELAIGTSPYAQGSLAAKMALKIALNHVEPSNLPPVTPSEFVVAMNGRLLHAHGASLPAVYEAAARSANKYRE